MHYDQGAYSVITLMKMLQCIFETSQQPQLISTFEKQLLLDKCTKYEQHTMHMSGSWLEAFDVAVLLCRIYRFLLACNKLESHSKLYCLL